MSKSVRNKCLVFSGMAGEAWKFVLHPIHPCIQHGCIAHMKYSIPLSEACVTLGNSQDNTIIWQHYRKDDDFKTVLQYLCIHVTILQKSKFLLEYVTQNL